MTTMSSQNDNEPRTPRVIISADRVLQTYRRRPDGYSPALGVQMARAHCWAPYDAVASALRSLALQGGLGEDSRDRGAARATLRRLFERAAPFGANVRFPEGQVFLSVDHGLFGQCMYRILTELLRVEGAAGTPNKQRMADACQAFMKAVAAAAAALAQPEVRATPVLYDQYLFEETFGLTWTPAKP